MLIYGAYVGKAAKIGFDMLYICHVLQSHSCSGFVATFAYRLYYQTFTH
jgi:hypothetical protein